MCYRCFARWPTRFATLTFGCRRFVADSNRSPCAKDVVRSFETLGLAQMSTFVEIRKRYYELAKLHHPDAVCPIAAATETVNQRHMASSTERMIQINDAFELLKKAHTVGTLPSDRADRNRRSDSSNGADVTSNHGKDKKSTNDGSGHGWPSSGGGSMPGGGPSSSSSSTTYSESNNPNGERKNHHNSNTTSSSSASPSSNGHASSRHGRSNGSSHRCCADSSRRSLRFLYNEATPALRNPFIETKEDEAPNFTGFYFQRTYAKTVAGRTVTTRFDAHTCFFTLTFQGDPFCESNLTRIVLHEEAHYPNGFDVSVSVTGPCPAGMKTGENGDDIYHNIEGHHRKKEPKEPFFGSDTTASSSAENKNASPSSTYDANVVTWSQPQRNLVEVVHERKVVAHRRLQVTVSIRPKGSSCT